MLCSAPVAKSKESGLSVAIQHLTRAPTDHNNSVCTRVLVVTPPTAAIAHARSTDTISFHQLLIKIVREPVKLCA